MARKLVNKGHTVKGALAAYFAPRLAADKALKPGELDKMLLGIKVGPYKEQIPLLKDAALALTKGRLAKDADVDDLAELLEALGGPDLDDDPGEEEFEDKGISKDEDEDMAMDTPEEHGKALMQLLSGLDLPEDALEQINTHINGMTKQPAADAGAEAGAAAAEPPAAGKKPAVPPAAGKKPANAAPMKEVPVTKPALDARLKTEGDRIAKDTREQIGSLFEAARDVEPILGRINALAFDSANDIYKEALKVQGVDIKDVHPSAYKRLLEMSQQRPSVASDSSLAADTSSMDDYHKRYTVIPAKA